jgi:hypothetical protein
MYDVAERLLASEAANAKTVLEQLWALKKNMEEDAQTGTVDLIIDFYQEKMDILRNKEEKIKKVSRDSRSLLEEKRKRDREIATIKQEVRDCSSEIERLTKKLDQLKVKEQELTLIETQVQRELQGNANEVINGLYEIILARQDGMSVSDADGDDDRPARGAVIPDGVGEEDEEGSGDAAWEPSAKTGLGLERETDPDSSNGQVDNGGGAESANAAATAGSEEPVVEEAPPFPKSVVKTTRGRVIGEYYYDPKMYKNRRQYIYNSDFFCTRLGKALNVLKVGFDQGTYGEAKQMIADACTRIAESSSLHFEVSTNEILNEDTLRQLLVDMKARRFDECARLCARLKAKINAMGSNYRILLKEQMVRYSES